ncbi:MAG: histidinol-phosphatase [Clostridiaceae bacterium]|nr:histidinol-phosphatase [Clostridiaceae bacterium]
MFKCNFHAHSRFDDGTEELESYIQSALTNGFRVFGFSGHAPVNFDSNWNIRSEDLEEYTNTAKALKDKYKDSIEIYVGLETDFYPGCTDWRKKRGIDYTIGAVHFLKNEETGQYMPVDGNRQEFEETLRYGFGGDMESFISAYYGKLREMLLTMPPNIVAHLDVIKKNNENQAYFSEDDEVYRDEVIKTLEVVSLTHTIVEVNTGGISRGYVKEPYPSRWILESCFDMDIPVILSSDCHHPDNIDYYFDEACDLLKSIGFKSQRVLYGDEWRDVAL